MPNKKTGGGKRQKRANQSWTPEKTNNVPFCKEHQRYAIVTKMLGDRRLLAKCSDGLERLCHIPGLFKGKQYWINIGKLILINDRKIQDDKCDVIYVYSDEDAHKLKKWGELKAFAEKEPTSVSFEDNMQNNEDAILDSL